MDVQVKVMLSVWFTRTGERGLNTELSGDTGERNVVQGTCLQRQSGYRLTSKECLLLYPVDTIVDNTVINTIVIVHN